MPYALQMALRWRRWGMPAAGGVDDQPAARFITGLWALRFLDVLQAEKRAAESERGFEKMDPADVKLLAWLRKLDG